MTAWLNRTTKAREDVLSPAQMTAKHGGVFVDGSGMAVSNADWIFNPDLTAVAGQPVKYWVCQSFPDDTVTLADAAGQAAADAAETQAEIDVNRAEAVTRASLDIGTRELVDVLLFEINKCNTRIQELQDALVAVKGTSGGSDNIRAAIPDPSVTTNPAPTEFTRVNPKLRSDVLQDYVDGINAGNADPT